jgi:hypothetical protein
MKIVFIIFLLFTLNIEAACLSPSPLHHYIRSPSIKHKFDVLSSHPHGNPGMIVDHICSLCQGGIDSITNMQYQTKAESDAKDLVENTSRGKKLYCTPANSTPLREVYNK